MRVSYLGTHFCGWQKQRGLAASGAMSVQETIEQALSKIQGEAVKIQGSGRTDAGVHAAAQVAHFTLPKLRYDLGVYRRALNGTLPPAIRVLGIFPVRPDFHAQKNATAKQYSYYFQQGPCAWPALKDTTWWIRKPLDFNAMNQAVEDLKGRHDFKVFQAAGGTVTTTVREIFEADVTRLGNPFPGAGHGLDQSFPLIRLRLKGSGFLKQMVRSIAGVALAIGDGQRGTDEFQRLLKDGKRADLPPTAPSRGLWLEAVWYDEPFDLPGSIV